jgi:hypothetical protein
MKKHIKKPPSIVVLIEYLEKEISNLAIDAAKFDRGNAPAGVRTRVKLQKIVYDIKEVRYEILSRKKKWEEVKEKKSA